MSTLIRICVEGSPADARPHIGAVTLTMMAEAGVLDDEEGISGFIEVHVRRCKLARCQRLLPPGKEYCDDVHRSEFHNKKAPAAPAEV